MEPDQPGRQILRIAVAGLVIMGLAAPRAAATLRIQRDAVTLGYPASNCSYCHVFDSEHMRERGKSQGVEVRTLDCYACHKSRLPRTGARLLNGRGLFLIAAKRHMQAPKVMAEWLKTYREPSAAPPRSQPTPRPTAQP